MSKHWTERMFVENPSLFRVGLEKAVEGAKMQVIGLEKIFLEFGIPEQGLVLDLCCGIGRHSVALAEKGYQVVGVDLSLQYINRANELACERNVAKKVEFKVGDMRNIANILENYRTKINAVINLFSSIGYYSEEDDKEVLTQTLNLTAPSGVLIIDTKNRDWLVRHFLHRGIEYIDDDLILIEDRKLNLDNSRMENTWQYYRKNGKNLEFLDSFSLNHRVYSLHELKQLIVDSGWTYKKCYGGYNLEPFTMDSNRMILIAKKEK